MSHERIQVKERSAERISPLHHAMAWLGIRATTRELREDEKQIYYEPEPEHQVRGPILVMREEQAVWPFPYEDDFSLAPDEVYRAFEGSGKFLQGTMESLAATKVPRAEEER